MLILNNSYEKLCDLNWETGDSLPEESLIHVHLDHIYEFFELIRTTERRYIVVSSNSDYGVEYQQRDTVERDMIKHFHTIDPTGNGYMPVLVPARCDTEYCRITDKYLVKMYSFSKRSFNEIPENVVKWFCVNANIQDNRIVRIPFGIPEWSSSLVGRKTNKEFKVYLNLQCNSLERLNLIKQYKYHPDVLFEENVSHEQFIKSMESCAYAFCPSGNGLDSYRVLEALYCGTVPILRMENWSEVYATSPAVYCYDFYNGGLFEHLRRVWEEGKLHNVELQPETNLEFWAEQFEAARQLIES